MVTVPAPRTKSIPRVLTRVVCSYWQGSHEVVGVIGPIDYNVYFLVDDSVMTVH